MFVSPIVCITSPCFSSLTGYSGGAVLTAILESPAIKNISISALVRRAEQAETLRAHGVTPILFKGLDDLALLEEVSSEFDVVLNCANAFHTTSAVAMIKGLAKRKEKTGKEVHFIHVSTAPSLANTKLALAYLTQFDTDFRNIQCG